MKKIIIPLEDADGKNTSLCGNKAGQNGFVSIGWERILVTVRACDCPFAAGKDPVSPGIARLQWNKKGDMEHVSRHHRQRH